MKQLIGHTHEGFVLVISVSFIDGAVTTKTFPAISKEMILDDSRLYSSHTHELEDIPELPDLAIKGKWHIEGNYASTHKHVKVSINVHLTSFDIVLIII